MKISLYGKDGTMIEIYCDKCGRTASAEKLLHGYICPCEQNKPYLKPMSPLDKIEMEQTKKRLISESRPNAFIAEVRYRGFKVTLDTLSKRPPHAERDEVQLYAPLDTLLHIIFLITKD